MNPITRRSLIAGIGSLASFPSGSLNAATAPLRTVEVRAVGGTPLLFVNGKPANPLIYWPGPHRIESQKDGGGSPITADVWEAQHKKAIDAIAMAAKQGVHIHSFDLWTPWFRPGKRDFSDFDRAIDIVLTRDPDGLCLPRFDLDAPSWWRQAHPECGYYLLDDLVAGKIPPKKLYIFLNCFFLTDEKETAIAQQCAGKTCVFFYANGFLRDTAGVLHMSRLLQAPVILSDTPVPGEVRTVSDPLTTGVDTFGTDFPLSPVFSLDRSSVDGARSIRVLGNYSKERPARAVAIHGGIHELLHRSRDRPTPAASTDREGSRRSRVLRHRRGGGWRQLVSVHPRQHFGRQDADTPGGRRGPRRNQRTLCGIEGAPLDRCDAERRDTAQHRRAEEIMRPRNRDRIPAVLSPR